MERSQTRSSAPQIKAVKTPVSEQQLIERAILAASQNGYGGRTVQETIRDIHRNREASGVVAHIPPELAEEYGWSVVYRVAIALGNYPQTQPLADVVRLAPETSPKAGLQKILNARTTADGTEINDIAKTLLANSHDANELQGILDTIGSLYCSGSSSKNKQLLLELRSSNVIPRHLMCVLLLTLRKKIHNVQTLLDILDDVTACIFDGHAIFAARRQKPWMNGMLPEQITIPLSGSEHIERGTSLLVQKYITARRAAQLLGVAHQDLPKAVAHKLKSSQHYSSKDLDNPKNPNGRVAALMRHAGLN